MAMEVIATVTSVEQAAALHEACAPAYFRVNASHMSTESLGAFCDAYARVAGLRDVPLYIDLQGAKLRVHGAQPQCSVAAGERVALVCLAADASEAPAAGGDTKTIFVGPNIMALLRAGAEVGIDDAKVELVVEAVAEDGGRADAVVRRGGVVRARKGFNLRPHPVTHTALCERDRAHVAATRGHSFVRYALSFACLPSEVDELRALAGPERVVAVKLERPLDTAAAVALGTSAGELWVCRGDLGAQMGTAGALAVYYRRFVADTLPRLLEARCRVVMAGEVLDHMCGAPAPTRSEVCHLADLWAAGFDAIVVSNETAFGKFPLNVLAVFRDVADALAKEFPRT